MAQIANLLEWDRERVRYRLRSLGVEFRTRGEGKRLRHRSEVWVGEVRGRLMLGFREYGELRQFPLAWMVALIDHPPSAVFSLDVHHDNGCKLDDRPTNLRVLSHGDHMAEHGGPPPRWGNPGRPDAARDPQTGQFIPGD